MISKLLDEITDKVRQEFGTMTEEQLNRQPAAGKWSIAQCLEHLIVSNSTYFPGLAQALSADYRPGWWQRINPLTASVGKNSLKVLRSEKIKLNAPEIFRPSLQRIAGDIVARFAAHQRDLMHYCDRVEQAGLQGKIVKSPLMRSVSLKVGDVMNIILEHERRHLQQAMNVKRENIDKE